ncbi:glucoamylase family protein [Cohnella kolymensis]|uniref:glucoamylase family protein n=1 Tax=Cohnella kolymensis TaxID=1590652 RepID=UPI000A479AB2|nr:glucoamylase family protein [Cohnella kolymensis]
MVRDRAPGTALNAQNMSSVASVGFGLSAIVIGADRGWITREEGFERARGTLNTLLHHAAQKNGFFYHFLNMQTAERYGSTELSIIDTGIAINGALSAGEYFGGEVKELADQLYKNVDWEWYRDPNPGERFNQFYMGYSPEHGFSGHWDFYAEQFMLYFLGAASPTHPVNSDMFYDFMRRPASYGGYPEFIHSWFGSIFTHQFSFAWFDMRNMVDREGVNWWNNSVVATKSSRQFAIDNSAKYKTFGPDSWGLTASDGPYGYEGRYGSAPSGFGNDQHRIDGTMAPAGTLGSIVFTPNEVISALRHYYSYPNLIGEYGLKDAYNLDVSAEGWYGEDVIGIDKGITLVMIENYRTGLLWNLMNKNKYVQAGMKKVGLVNLGSTVIDDFEGNHIHTGWKDNGDGVYALTPDSSLSHTGTGALKIDYNKNGNPWAAFSAAFDGDHNFSSADSFKASVYGNATLLLKFETSSQPIEKTFTVTGDHWNEIEWIFTAAEKEKLQAAKRLLIFAAPGTDQASGTFYLDDLQVNGKGPAASNLLIEGKPVVGETLTASYNYFSPEGLNEGDSRYRWLKSQEPNGAFEPIAGAVSKTYTVQSSDVGSYLKFEVTPVSVPDPNTGESLTGKALSSDPTKAVEVAEPTARNVTITTVPGTTATIIDNFDGQGINPDWKDSGDSVYTLSLDNTVTTDGSNALKIDYNKDLYDWAFLKGTVDPAQPYFAGDTLSFDVNGKYNFILKFEEVSGQHEHSFQGDTNGKWETLTWDISALKNELGDVQRILLFIEPAYKHLTGTVYIDNFKVLKMSQIDLTKEQPPVVGSPVYGSYDFYDANGDQEQGSIYRWYRADEKHGKFKQIKDASSRTYTPTEKDLGKFLKFEVTPMSDHTPNAGATATSASTLIVTK